MNKSVKISIIVPVYKVEEYLDKCVKSIINQTYKNLEIILVDDGSPDKCGLICDQYALLDPRIKVFHQSNGGLSAARNSGLNIASGEYIGFVDSDDWVKNTMYEKLLQAMLNNKATITECGTKYVYDDKEQPTEENTVLKIFKDLKAIEYFLDRTYNITGSVWNKLYHKSIFENLRFEVGKLHEDAYFTYRAIYKSKVFVLLYEEMYFYRQNRPGSIMMEGVFKKDNILFVLKAFEERNMFFQNENKPMLVKRSKAYYYRTVLTEYYNSRKYISKDLDFINKLKKIINDNFLDIMLNKYIGIRRFKFLIFKFIPWMNLSKK